MAKAGYETTYRLTLAQINAGIVTAKSGGIIDVINDDGTLTGEIYIVGAAGVIPKPIMDGNAITEAIIAGNAPNWPATAAVKINQIRVATADVDNIKIGDLIRSLSDRTTGAIFDATEAANWEEVSTQVKVVNSLSEAASNDDKMYAAGSLGNDLTLDSKIGTTAIIDNDPVAPTITTQGYVTMGAKKNTGKWVNGNIVWRRSVKGYWPNNGNEVQNVNGVVQQYLLDLGTDGRLISFAGFIKRNTANQYHNIVCMPPNGPHLHSIYLGGTGTQLRIWNTMQTNDYNGGYFEASVDYISPVAFS